MTATKAHETITLGAALWCSISGDVSVHGLGLMQPYTPHFSFISKACGTWCNPGHFHVPSMHFHKFTTRAKLRCTASTTILPAECICRGMWSLSSG